MASKDYVEIAETEGNNMANPMDMMKQVTTPDGHERISNIKLTQEDLETIEILKNLKK